MSDIRGLAKFPVGGGRGARAGGAGGSREEGAEEMGGRGGGRGAGGRGAGGGGAGEGTGPRTTAGARPPPRGGGGSADLTDFPGTDSKSSPLVEGNSDCVRMNGLRPSSCSPDWGLPTGRRLATGDELAEGEMSLDKKNKKQKHERNSGDHQTTSAVLSLESVDSHSRGCIASQCVRPQCRWECVCGCFVLKR